LKDSIINRQKTVFQNEQADRKHKERQIASTADRAAERVDSKYKENRGTERKNR
jgi:hypothetical protein